MAQPVRGTALTVDLVTLISEPESRPNQTILRDYPFYGLLAGARKQKFFEFTVNFFLFFLAGQPENFFEPS